MKWHNKAKKMREKEQDDKAVQDFKNVPCGKSILRACPDG